MKKIVFLCCLLGALVCFSGCSKSDDVPEPSPEAIIGYFTLTVNGEELEKNERIVPVPATGGTYIISEKYKENFVYPNAIEIDGKDTWIPVRGEDNPLSTVPNFHYINLVKEHLIGDWYDIFVEEDMKSIVAKILPNETGVERNIVFYISHMNYGKVMELRQSAK
ncbi:MAG: hypothetical protein Q4E60_09330 [Bacteroidales bacterium]|nr:hypothetical protein [Bacteroidales bacterium]